MTRRWALTAAFFLTVLVGFAIVTWGSNTGVFAWSGGSTQSAAVQQPAPGGASIGDPSIPVSDAASSNTSSDTRHDDGEREHSDDNKSEHENDD
jgi:hypothetical protein